MHHTRIWISAGIIAAVVLVGFALSVPHTRDVPHAPATTTASTTPAVTLHDAYRRGTHTLTGTIVAPDACSVVSADATLVGDASSSQSIALSISMPPDSGVCLMLPTVMPFSATLSAPAQLPVTVTVNGEAATTTGP